MASHDDAFRSAMRGLRQNGGGQGHVGGGVLSGKPKLTVANATTPQEKAILAARAKNRPGPGKVAVKYEDGSVAFVAKSKGGRA